MSFRVRAENTREILRVHEKGKSRSGSGQTGEGGGEGVSDGDGGSDGERKNQLTNLPGIRHASYSVGKPWVGTVVGNKTVFRHEISVQLCRLRRIKSSYESHVIDVVDFRKARNPPLCIFRHICRRRVCPLSRWNFIFYGVSVPLFE